MFGARDSVFKDQNVEMNYRRIPVQILGPFKSVLFQANNRGTRSRSGGV